MTQLTHDGGWAIDVRAAHAPAARGWLRVALAILGGALLCAALATAARYATAAAGWPGAGAARVALVLYVEWGVLAWPLAFGGLLWALRDGPHGAWDARVRRLVAAGAALLALSALTGARPLPNGFVPVLLHPLHLAALGLLALGLAARAFLSLERGLDAAHRNPVSAGLFLAALATLLAAFTVLRTGLRLPPYDDPALRFAVLFWPAGHVLQLAFTALAMTAWTWLAAASGLRPPVPPRALTLLLLSGALPFLGVLLIELTTAVGSVEQRTFYARLVRWGGLWPLLPVGLLVLYACLRGAPAAATGDAARRALHGSLLLFAAGLLLDAVLAVTGAVAPVRHHGVLAGTSLALMGLAYRLLPQLGYGAADPRFAHRQPTVYSAGQLLHLAGLAWPGGAGGVLAPATLLGESGWLLTLVGGGLFLAACRRALYAPGPR